MNVVTVICFLLFVEGNFAFLINSSEIPEEQSIQEPRRNPANQVIDETNRFFRNPFFPLFVITVRPTPCLGQDGVGGVCKTKRDCENLKGQVDGTCAGRFGVCCLLENRCGAVVRMNNSILVNDQYPDSQDGAGNCQYVIEKVNPDVTQMRIDFLSFVLSGPDESTSLCEDDTFSVVGSLGQNPNVLCGVNTGQHIYIDVPRGTGSVRINISTRTSGFARSWRLKVTQYQSDSVNRAPVNCLQYYDDYSGTITSFNYQGESGVHIGNLGYSICIGAREGYCGITYQSDDFSVSGNNTADAEALSGETDCDGSDFIFIFVQDKAGNVGPSRYCGTAFNTTSTYAKPFIIRVITDSEEPSTDIDNRGFSLSYNQIPC